MKKPFVYVELTAEEVAEIAADTLKMQKKPRIESFFVPFHFPGEVHPFTGERTQYYVVRGREKGIPYITYAAAQAAKAAAEMEDATATP